MLLATHARLWLSKRAESSLADQAPKSPEAFSGAPADTTTALDVATIATDRADHSAEHQIPAWKRAANHTLHGAHILLDALEVSEIVAGAALSGIVGMALVGLGMASMGVSHTIEGVNKQSKQMVLEGASGILLGAKSGLTAVVHATAHASGAVAGAAHAMEIAVAPVGVAAGVVEAAAGAREIYQGLRSKDRGRVLSGALTAGLGVSLGVAAVGGGLPALVAAGAILAGRAIWEERGAIKKALNPPDSSQETAQVRPDVRAEPDNGLSSA